MTIKELLWFRCRVCNKDFLSYVLGHFLKCFYEDIHKDGICFYDNRIGEIHNNHVFNPLKGDFKCRKCRKSNQLEEFYGIAFIPTAIIVCSNLYNITFI